MPPSPQSIGLPEKTDLDTAMKTLLIAQNRRRQGWSLTALQTMKAMSHGSRCVRADGLGGPLLAEKSTIDTRLSSR